MRKRGKSEDEGGVILKGTGIRMLEYGKKIDKTQRNQSKTQQKLVFAYFLFAFYCFVGNTSK